MSAAITIRQDSNRALRGHMFLLFGLCLTLVPASGCRRDTPSPPGAVRIMPLGDSITQGEHKHPSYRRPLWLKLKKAGYNVDFVGGMKKQQFGGGARDFDRDHEGHWGWPIYAVLEKGDPWIAANTPDIALVHLGSNDLLSEETPADTVEHLMALVEMLRRHNPKMTVLLATLIPPAAPALRPHFETFNGLLRNAIPAAQQESSRIVLVDQYEGFVPVRHTYDGIHPNEIGAEMIAQKWFSALVEVLDKPNP